MNRFFLIAVALLLLGPLRKRFLFPLLAAWWRTVAALVVGGVVGHVIVSRFMPGAPAWMTIAGPAMSAFMIGGAVHELIMTVFPPRSDRNAR